MLSEPVRYLDPPVLRPLTLVDVSIQIFLKTNVQALDRVLA